jgi:large subunit ribosomal protein L24e
MYDKTLEFENRKEEPIRYNRDLMVTTIKAIKRIEEIKETRQKDHWKERMRIARLKNPNEISNVMEKHVNMIKDKTIKDKITKRIKKKRTEKINKKEKLTSLLIEDEDASGSEDEVLRDNIVQNNLKKNDLEDLDENKIELEE